MDYRGTTTMNRTEMAASINFDASTLGALVICRNASCA